MKRARYNSGGFTLIELLILIAILAVILSLVPCVPPRTKARAQRISCVSNLKQVGLAMRFFANDHDGKFPWMTATNLGGSMEFTNSSLVFRHFLAASNEIATPKVLLCRADSARTRVSDFTHLSNSNLSYFVSIDALPSTSNSASSILSGGRNILGGTAVSSTLRVVRKSDKLAWSKEIHRQAGNLGLADGSVLQVDDSGLNRAVAVMTNAAIRLAMP